MLLELTRWLQQLDDLFGLFGYLTFRGILSALTALALSLWWGPAVIRRLAQYKGGRSEEHTSELQSLMRISYAVFCLKKKKKSLKHKLAANYTKSRNDQPKALTPAT